MQIELHAYLKIGYLFEYDAYGVALAWGRNRVWKPGYSIYRHHLKIALPQRKPQRVFKREGDEDAHSP